MIYQIYVERPAVRISAEAVVFLPDRQQILHQTRHFRRFQAGVNFSISDFKDNDRGPTGTYHF
jgi:hypothetical protein